MKEAYIVDGVRTPIGSFGGSLSTVRPDDMAALVIAELLKRHPHLPHGQIDDVILGCANQAGEDNRNVARMSALIAGLPVEVPGETVNRLCASGMSAGVHAYRAIQAEEGHLFIAGGVENMTRGPWVISKTSTAFGRDAQMYDSSFGWRFVNKKLESQYGVEAMGETAENLADKYQISRERQDRFAVWSQKKYSAALQSGFYADELVSVPYVISKKESGIFDRDEFAKPDSTLEKLATLRASFRSGGTVTAGNAAGLNDGAAALLVADMTACKAHGLKPLARIVTSAVCGVPPTIMGIGPVPASKLALKRAGLTLDDMDVIEINEAFAAQVLACTTELGLDDDDARINPHGGAIAMGHPLGMTGARILLTAARNLALSGKLYALCTMCIGVGQGYAVILERV